MATQNSMKRKEFFAMEGFCIIDDFFDPEFVGQVKRIFESHLADGTKSKHIETAFINIVKHAIRQDVEIQNLLKQSGWQELLAEMDNAQPKVLLDEIVSKKQNKSFDTYWHQDKAFYPDSTLTVVIALDNLSEETGGFAIIPKSQNAALKHARNANVEIPHIEEAVDLKQVENLKLRAGDLLLIHPLLVHRGLPNRSDRSSMAYTLVLGQQAN